MPLRYDLGGRQWLQKFGIALKIFKHTRIFVRRYKDPWLLGYLALGGSYAAILGWLKLGRCATVCFEPHSKYMVEGGVWGRRSLKTRVMRILEGLQMRRSDLLIVPTEAGMELAMHHVPKGKVILQPIAIDVGRALFDQTSRQQFRTRFGLLDHLVVAYVGKFGGIYYTHAQYLEFIKVALQADPSLRFLIIASNADLDKLRSTDGFKALDPFVILHPPVPTAELHRVLSGADLGVIAVPPTPSQIYRTPVKTAHYWAAGLPLIIPKGISDDWKIVEREGLGIVTGDLPTLDPTSFMEQLTKLRAQDPAELRKRCIAAAHRYRDSDAMVQMLERELARPRKSADR